MKKKATVLAGVGLAVGLLLGAPAAAMADPYAPIPGEGTQTVAPGATVTLTTAGWDYFPGAEVTITYADALTLAAVTTVPVSTAGTASATFVAPSTGGAYAVTFAGLSGGVPASITLTITVDPALAYTGVSDPAPFIWLGGGLAVLGAAAVVTVIAVRRQNAKEHVSA